MFYMQRYGVCFVNNNNFVHIMYNVYRHLKGMSVQIASVCVHGFCKQPSMTNSFYLTFCSPTKLYLPEMISLISRITIAGAKRIPMRLCNQEVNISLPNVNVW